MITSRPERLFWAIVYAGLAVATAAPSVARGTDHPAGIWAMIVVMSALFAGASILEARRAFRGLLSWAWLTRLRAALGPIPKPDPLLAAAQKATVLREREDLDDLTAAVRRRVGPRAAGARYRRAS